MNWPVILVIAWSIAIGAAAGLWFAKRRPARREAEALDQFVSSIIRQGRLDRKFAGMRTVGTALIRDTDGVAWKITVENSA